jgi:uncharacterized protein YjbI with pentapeptide repeats
MTPQIVSRWSTNEVGARCQELNGRTVRDTDLRGFPFAECGKISRLRAEGLDLSWSQFKDAWVEASIFRETLFDHANLKGVADHGNQFDNCQFLRADFSGASLGHKGSRYSRCTFDRCRFTKCGFVRPIFEDCSFLNCGFESIDFGASSFARCRFVGPVRNVWFRDGFPHRELENDFGAPTVNTMDRVDFSDATLWGVTFSGGVDLTRIILPRDEQHYLYDAWPERVRQVQASTHGDGDIQVKARRFVRAFAPRGEQQQVVINKKDLQEMYGAAATDFILDNLGAPRKPISLTA